MKIPKYIDEILRGKANIVTTINGNVDNIDPGYTIRLFGDWPRGYENKLLTSADKLVAWARRNGADAYTVQRDMWYHHYDCTNAGYSKAARDGYWNHIYLVITDPVMLELEKAGLVKR